MAGKDVVVVILKEDNAGQEAAQIQKRRRSARAVMTGISLLPNAVTLCAMGCGLYSLTASFRGEYPQACTAILLAGLLDALDGWVAQLTGSTSRLGRYLDSVSDFVGFCLAPGALVLGRQLHAMGMAGWATAVFYVVCGGWRLVRYNRQADSVESRSFTGMPTTVAAILVAACALVSPGDAASAPGLARAWVWGMLFLGVLMVSTIRFRSAKEMLGQRKGRSGPIVAAGGLAFLVLSVWVPVVILAGAAVYALWGVFEELFLRLGRLGTQKKGTPVAAPDANRIEPDRAAPS